MISHKHKAIFVHIPKTAGSSIEKKLGLFEHLERHVQDHRPFKEYELMSKRGMFSTLRCSFYHLRHNNMRVARRYLKEAIWPEIDPEQFENYFKFSFVRNSQVEFFRGTKTFYATLSIELIKASIAIARW